MEYDCCVFIGHRYRYVTRRERGANQSVRVSKHETTLIIILRRRAVLHEGLFECIEVQRVVAEHGELALVARVKRNLAQFALGARQLSFWDLQEAFTLQVIDGDTEVGNSTHNEQVTATAGKCHSRSTQGSLKAKLSYHSLLWQLVDMALWLKAILSGCDQAQVRGGAHLRVSILARAPEKRRI